ncbi:DUF6282 family protein [Oceanobacillus jeddahense]|uniref:DUF6282 family protein n=1 Tax=Oceanobacillus jeddahense TaxID=1462527 RepID=UPI0006933CBE|nr:DUF6282 family protein [Oceanobacillus jeddahense]
MDFNGMIDMHIHSAPDLRERKHTDKELMLQAEKLGMRAIVIKSHCFPTTDRAWHLNQGNKKVQAVGSVTCNAPIGGLNRIAVENAIKLGAKIIWLPTNDAKNHRTKMKQAGGIELLHGSQLSDEAVEVIELASEYNVVLGTGHISKEEIYKVAEKAKSLNFRKLVITHPEFHIVDLSIGEQINLLKEFDLKFERTYAQPIGGGMYKSNLEINLEAIKRVGYESTIVSTDSGQIENPPWNISFPSYIEYLLENGISEKELIHMTKTLPLLLLGL